MGNIHNELPFDYGTMNLYNYNRSPSTVHVKNTRLRAYFRKYLFQKAISVFDWKLPEDKVILSAKDTCQPRLKDAQWLFDYNENLY